MANFEPLSITLHNSIRFL